MPSLPNANEPHTVPSEYFKIVYDIKGNAKAFTMKQTTPRKADYCNKSTSIASIQDRLNYQLPKQLVDSAALLARLDC
jgi:endonuclease G